MEKFLILFLASALFASVSLSQKKGKIVKFVVNPIIQPEDTAICIVGNHPSIGNWNPSKAPLKKQKDGSWQIEVKIEEGYNLEYKFTKGSWAKEAVNASGAIPHNAILSVKNDTVINVIVENWLDNFQKASGLKITGNVEYLRNMEGEGILPRDVVIWLPPDYKKNKKKKYPVLYMHDGQNIFDPATSSFGVDWQIDETADSLIKQKKMKEIIIVGIYNTSNRSEEYSYGVLGHEYMSFIVKQLKPVIDKKYRTLKDRKNTATMGSSMGGLISLMLAWEHTDVFSKAGCLSPAFKVQEFNYLPYIEKYKGKKKNIKLYIDDGSVGLEKTLLPGIKETIDLLNSKGYETGKDILWFYDEGAEHNESAWAARAWRPLLFMFRK